MRVRSSVRGALLFALLLFVAGCKSSSLIGTAPVVDNNQDAPPRGLRYYPGKDVVVLKIDVTETTVVEPNEALEIKKKTTTKREGTATLNTVADTARPFVIDLEPGGRFDNTLVVEVRPSGLLKSINAQSTGKAGDAIVSLAKFTATISGLPLAAGGGGAETTCDANAAPANRLSLRVRTAIDSNAVVCELFKEVEKMQDEIAKFEAHRLKLQRRAPTASADELTLNNKRIAAINETLGELRKKFTDKQTEFMVKVAEFVAAKELGTITKTTSFADMLDLAELPALGVVGEDMTVDQVKTKLANYTSALSAFDRTGAVATIETPPSWSDNKTVASDQKNLARIFFRQGQPLRLKVFVRSDCGEGKPECLRTLSDQVLDVLHSGTGVQFVAFDEHAFAQRKLMLAFDEKGRPEKLERSGTSELAAFTATLSNAATTLRDEFATTLTKVGEIQASQRTIELNDMTAELNRLKKEKEILDARIAVEGGALNFANNVEQSRLAAELAALQAEIALKSAQSTAEQNIEIAKLKSATSLLVEELNLIKARLAVEEARR